MNKVYGKITKIAALSFIIVSLGSNFDTANAKQDTKLLANVTDTASVAEAVTTPLGVLNWLIGDWEAENNGAKVRMKADWTKNKKFILCKYEIDKPGQEQLSETQVVGWDPQSNEIVSWNFDASGGFGHGIWNKKTSKWLIESSGVASDGVTTRALNIISIVDPNNFSWQSIDRRADGVALADTEPLKVKRLTK